MDTIQYTKVNSSILNTKEQCTGHVYLFTKYNSTICVIVGHHAIHNNAASLGGFKKDDETLLENICREFSEETLDCLMNKDELVHRLYNSPFITRKSVKGQHYTAFTDVRDIVFDMNRINSELTEKLKNPDLAPDQREHDYLTLIPLDNIKKALTSNNTNDNIIVKDYMGLDIKIRDINVPAYRWALFDGLDWI